MSSYTVDDFKYSLSGGFYGDPKQFLGGAKPTEVLYAYGDVDDEKKCCDECGGEWSGGFVVTLDNGKVAHIEGWCDYTGWGCRDGSKITFVESINDIHVHKHWDYNPADLNNALPRIWKELS